MSLLANASLVTICGLLAQAVGLVRLIIVASVFGISQTVDAYYLGLIVPSLVILVVANWLQLAFLGRYTELVTQAQVNRAHAFKMAVLCIVLIIGCSVSWLGFVFPHLPFFPDTQSGEAFQILILMVLPGVVADFMGQTLNGHRRFLVAAIAPVANGVVAVAILLAWPHQGLQALTVSLVFGTLTQLAIVAGPFYLLDARVRFSLGTVRDELKQVAPLTGWIVPGVLLSNLMLGIMQATVAQFGTGAVTAIAYANRINGALVQFMVMGLSRVLLPEFAALSAKSEHDTIVLLFRRLMRGATLASITALGGIYLLAELGIGVALVRGEFEPQDALTVHELLILLCLSILPMALGTFVARFFSATRRADLLLYSGVMSSITVLCVAGIGLVYHDIRIVALAPLAAYTVTFTFWFVKLKQVYVIKPILLDLGHGLLRTSLMVGVAVLTISFLQDYLLYLDEFWRFFIGSAAYLSLVTTLVFASGTSKWLLESYASTESDNQSSTHGS